MTRAARYEQSIRECSAVTIPAGIVALVLVLPSIPAILFGAVMAFNLADDWRGWLGAALLALLALMMVVGAVQNFRTLPSAFRFAPEGLSYRGSPFVPWSETVQAFTRVQGLSPSRTVIRVMLTPDGYDRFTGQTTPAARRNPSTLDPTVAVSKMRGCSTAETVRLLNEAITDNRHHLGLPPIR